MPSYNQLLYHVVFATKYRENTLTDDIRKRVFNYMGGIIRSLGGSSQIIGGMPDHVHILLRYRPDAALSDLIRDIKSNSSKWIYEELRRPDFAWQEGYSIFSVGKSGENKVIAYIQNQEKHHKTMDSKNELLKLLEKHGIEVEMRYFQ